MDERPELVVLDTMNFWMDIAMEPLKAVIARVDVLTINDEEARQLQGERSLIKAARSYFEMGPRYFDDQERGTRRVVVSQRDEGVRVLLLPGASVGRGGGPHGSG